MSLTTEQKGRVCARISIFYFLYSTSLPPLEKQWEFCVYSDTLSFVTPKASNACFTVPWSIKNTNCQVLNAMCSSFGLCVLPPRPSALPFSGAICGRGDALGAHEQLEKRNKSYDRGPIADLNSFFAEFRVDFASKCPPPSPRWPFSPSSGPSSESCCPFSCPRAQTRGKYCTSCSPICSAAGNTHRH